MTPLKELRERVEKDFSFEKLARQNQLNFLRWMDARGYLWPWQKAEMDALAALEQRDSSNG